MRILSNRNRPLHLGPLPLERLARSRVAPDPAALHDRFPAPSRTALGRIVNEYIALFEQFRSEDPAPERAPYPKDSLRLANELKANCYFLNASLAACCGIPDSAWSGAPIEGHRHALAIVVEFGRDPEPGNLAADWVRGSEYDCALLRAAEIALISAAFLRRLGYSATAHTRDRTDVSHAAILRCAGLVYADQAAPFIGKRYASCVVTTSEPLAADRPLAGHGSVFAGGLGWWLGAGGSETWWERWLASRRPSDGSRFPMEKIRRVPEATTLILEDEVPRVPKRANFFTRALHGDLGEKAQRERWRFAYKTPIADAYVKLIRAMVPLQNGNVFVERNKKTNDPVANARGIKSLMYYLGADMAGACEAKRYAWYSHQDDGTPIDIYHRSAVVMLVDQGFDTMEGASGDDWISGAQSMRAYMRGGEICGVVAAFIRSLGWSARSQTNADSDVLQLPLVLLAGLGELSRIGELVLNPFVGPRFKSAVVTTDLPLAMGPADRLRPAGYLQQVHEVRARVPLQRHLVRRQGDVQRLRDVEAGRGALHALPRHQPARFGLRPLHEDLPLQPRGPARAPHGPVGGNPSSLDAALDRALRRSHRQRLDQPGKDLVDRPGDRGRQGRACRRVRTAGTCRSASLPRRMKSLTIPPPRCRRRRPRTRSRWTVRRRWPDKAGIARIGAGPNEETSMSRALLVRHCRDICRSAGARAGLADQAGALRRAVPAGRLGRPARAAARRQARPSRSRQQFIVENKPGRLGLDRHRVRRQGAARRLHLRGRLRYPRGEPVADLQAAVRHGEGFRAGDAGRHRALWRSPRRRRSPRRSSPTSSSAAKAKPDSVSIGSIGNGTIGHLVLVQAQQMAGFKIVHVPFKGGGPMNQNILGGQIDMGIGSVALLSPQVKGGKLRAIATTGPEALARRCPTCRRSIEQGFPGFDARTPGGASTRPRARPSRSSTGSTPNWPRCLSQPDVRKTLSEASAWT